MILNCIITSSVGYPMFQLSFNFHVHQIHQTTKMKLNRGSAIWTSFRIGNATRADIGGVSIRPSLPGKINMEPENTPWKRKTIFQTNMFRFKLLIFGGVHQCAVVYKGHCAEWKNETSKFPSNRMKQKPMCSWAVKKWSLVSWITFQSFIPPLP